MLQTSRPAITASDPQMPPQVEQLMNLLQREAKILRTLDEAHDLDGVLPIGPLPGRRSSRWSKESTPLVVPQCLDIHPGRFRHRTDPSSFPLLMAGECTLYLGIEARSAF